MTTRRLMSQALRSMRRYKLRSSFMMIGSLIGVAALAFVVSVGQAAQARLLRTLRQILGESSVVVIGGGSRMMGSPRAGVSRLTIDDIEAVASEVSDVTDWDPQADLSGVTVRYNDAVATVRVLGSSERWQGVWARGVSRGESFDASAVSGASRVALIGETVARRIFADADPIGAEIRIGAVPFRVIGVLEPFGVDMHGMDRDNEILVPISTLLRRLTNRDAVNQARLLIADPSRQHAAVGEVTRVLRARHGLDRDQPNDFMVTSALAVETNMRMVERALWLYIPLVGGVVLLVGGIVAATLMLGSVSERVAEIGLRRAVGARPQDIHRQFLIETAATVVGGGIGGIVLAAVGVQLIASGMQLGVTMSWKAIAIGLGASALVGLLAGVVPARRAARLRPADALR